MPESQGMKVFGGALHVSARLQTLPSGLNILQLQNIQNNLSGAYNECKQKSRQGGKSPSHQARNQAEAAVADAAAVASL